MLSAVCQATWLTHSDQELEPRQATPHPVSLLALLPSLLCGCDEDSAGALTPDNKHVSFSQPSLCVCVAWWALSAAGTVTIPHVHTTYQICSQSKSHKRCMHRSCTQRRPYSGKWLLNLLLICFDLREITCLSTQSVLPYGDYGLQRRSVVRRCQESVTY